MNDKIIAMQENLCFFRQMLGWSAQMTGEKIGVTRQTINNLESQKTKLTKTQYLALVSVFKTESVSYGEETRMFQCIFCFSLNGLDDCTSSEAEEAISDAKQLTTLIASGKESRKAVSDEWIKKHFDFYQRYYSQLEFEYKSIGEKLKQSAPSQTKLNIFKKEKFKMKTAAKINFKNVIECNESEVVNHIIDFYKDYVLDPVKYALWVYVNDEGELLFEQLKSSEIARVMNMSGCIICSFGGNDSVWDILPKIDTLLGEDWYFYLDQVSQRLNKPQNAVTVNEMREYIEETNPDLISEWLDDYFSDPYGYIENIAEKIYDNLLDDLDAYEND